MATTPLKHSLYQLATRTMNADKAFLAKHANSKPLEVDDAVFEQYRNWRLRETLRYARDNARFYGDLPSDDRLQDVSANDLSALAFTSSGDLSADPYSFLCLSQTHAERAISFESSGTTGPRKRLFFTKGDLDAATDFMACGIATVLEPGQAVQIMLPGGPTGGQADLLRAGVAKMGGIPVVTGMDAPFSEQIAAIKANSSKVLFGETHLMYRLTKSAEQLYDLKTLGVSYIFVTTSYCSAVMREYLENAWGAEVSVHYGMTEMGLGVAVECPICHGMHYNELGVVLEIVDPLTGDPKPAGCPGEVVATSLGREAMPIIRFKTGDRAAIRPASPHCPCYPMPVLTQVAFRFSSQVRLLDGTLIHPTIFHDALFSISEVVDYELSVESGARGDRLVFDVETLDGRSDAQLTAKIKGHAWHALEDAGAIDRPDITVCYADHEQLRQGRHFKKLIDDRRDCLGGKARKHD